MPSCRHELLHEADTRDQSAEARCTHSAGTSKSGVPRMTSKPHLYISPGPFLRKPGIIEVLCHQCVPEPLFVQHFDFAIAGQNWKEIYTSLTCCPKCFRVAEEFCSNPPEELRTVKLWHIYAIVPRDSKLGNKLEAQLEESA